ncbi:Cancer-related nucleoside-triphosphatase [Durusdinium trenchii]|uniref:Cancer-related nucleoside-triphosphatase n=1 Tax=Durusdinium trenchii TaxID=1381693 RepID=A0ABP0QI41_9DINO
MFALRSQSLSACRAWCVGGCRRAATSAAAAGDGLDAARAKSSWTQDDFPQLLLDDQIGANGQHRALSSWAGLRSATSTALHRGKLDRYLWWRHAADARRRLSPHLPIREAEAEAATEVVLNCAKAGVDSPVYAAWVRAVSSPSSTFSVATVARAAQLLSRRQLKVHARFWRDGFPQLLQREPGSLDFKALAEVLMAYALRGQRCDHCVGTEEVLRLLEPQLHRPPTSHPSADAAARALVALRRLGRGGVRSFQRLWPYLEGRLGELEPLLLCGLAFSMARAFSGCGEEPCARAAELVRILSRVLGNDWLGPMGS